MAFKLPPPPKDVKDDKQVFDWFHSIYRWLTLSGSLTWALIDKTGSKLSDILNHSHTILDDIGTNTHASLDSHVAASANIHGVGAASSVVGTATAQALTNKTIDGDTNTVQNLALSTLKTVAGDANKVIRRNGAGAVVSDNIVPNSSALMTIDSTQSITNKQMQTSNKYGDGATNYTDFSTNGFMQAHGTATAFEDINRDSIALGTGAAAPGKVAVNGGTIYTYAFSGTNVTPDEVFGCVEIPHAYANGTDIIPHVHWMPTTTDAGNVKWQLTYSIAAVGSTHAAATGTSTGTSAAGGTAWKSIRTDLTTISGAGLVYGMQIFFRLFRDATDAADDYGHDAAVATFGFHFEVDALGSNTIASKT